MAPTIPVGFDLDSVLTTWPDAFVDPEPFRRLAESKPHPDHIARLCVILEAQDTCTKIMKHNGAAALRVILVGAARAAAEVGAPMSPRVASIALHLDLRVV